jgi:hypothetical protein
MPQKKRMRAARKQEQLEMATFWNRLQKVPVTNRMMAKMKVLKV